MSLYGLLNCYERIVSQSTVTYEGSKVTEMHVLYNTFIIVMAQKVRQNWLVSVIHFLNIIMPEYLLLLDCYITVGVKKSGQK